MWIKEWSFILYPDMQIFDKDFAKIRPWNFITEYWKARIKIVKKQKWREVLVKY